MNKVNKIKSDILSNVDTETKKIVETQLEDLCSLLGIDMGYPISNLDNKVPVWPWEVDSTRSEV